MQVQVQEGVLDLETLCGLFLYNIIIIAFKESRASTFVKVMQL